MRRLVVFDERERLMRYVEARAPHEFRLTTGELFFGDDVDVLVVVNDMDDAKRVGQGQGQGQEFTHVLYKYMASDEIRQYLSTRVR